MPLSYYPIKLPPGFEPGTCWFVINCSIQLSYDSMCAGRKTKQTRTNERGFHIARTCTNVRIADTGVEPVISCLGGKRGYPFHSSAIAVRRICTHKPKLKAYYWLQSVPKSIDTQHTSRLKTTSDRSAVIPYYFQHDNLLYPGYCNHWICSYLQQISFYRFYTCRHQTVVIGRNFSHGSRTRYSMDMSHMWLSVPLGWSAVWRSRTSKSFPTECLANISTTIMGIRLSASQYTVIYQEAYLLKEGVSNATLGESVEWDTNSRTRRNWFTVSLLCPLAYPPMRWHFTQVTVVHMLATY